MELIVLSISNILCFLIGAIVGQKVMKDRPIIKNPIESIKEHKIEKIQNEQDEYFKTLAENIDNYDGTSLGQKKLGG